MKRIFREAIASTAAGAALMLCAAAPAASQAALVSRNVTNEAVPTFAKDVAPIFQAKCQVCHQPNSIAPMSLLSYDDAKKYASKIRARVVARVMPPWHIDKTVGIQSFKNDRSLTDAQITTIAKWVDGGAPLGDPKDLPPAAKFPDPSRTTMAPGTLVLVAAFAALAPAARFAAV